MKLDTILTIFVILISLTGCDWQHQTTPGSVNRHEQTSLTPISPTASTGSIDNPVAQPTTLSTKQLTLFQTRSGYNPEWQYTIQYDEESWTIENIVGRNSFYLRHRALPCHLRLQGAIGTEWVETKEIGDNSWTLFADKLADKPASVVVYEQKGNPNYYTIGLVFGDGQDQIVPEAESKQCQIEAEMVLATFKIVP